MKKSFVPLREFVYDRLYHPKEGYFCRKGIQKIIVRFSSRLIKKPNQLQKTDRLR